MGIVISSETWIEDTVRLLKEVGSIVSITFTKADGSIRTLICTLDETCIPNESLPKGKRTTNKDVCCVWDLELGAWRSFRWDSVQCIEHR